MGKLTKKLGKKLVDSMFEDAKPRRGSSWGGSYSMMKSCRGCKGTGRLNGMKHDPCGGTGYVRI